MRPVLACIVAILLGLAAAVPAARGRETSPTRALSRPRKPVRVILDTDIGPDVDDVGATAILNAMADQGEARILAMGCCTSSEWGAPCQDAINTYYGRPDIPLGTLKREGFLPQSEYNAQVARRFPHALRSGHDAPDAASLYRQVLSRQPDHSVVMCAVGPLPNLARLLDSGPDAASRLTGQELVARKVRLLSVMGGRYPRGNEWNFQQDPAAAARVTRDWPTPILFSGFEIGERIHTGRRLHRETPEDDPVRAAYALFPGVDKERESWDLTAVLAAVRGPERYWDVRRGSVTVDPATGTDRWEETATGNRFYLVERDSPEAMQTVLDDLMVRPPQHRN
jgi:inosine-uridine nucleoside N-ribohydrolase